MFADRLKEARKQKKISQEKLSEMLNVSQSAISSYESGARKPDIDFLPQIAKALDVSVSYLLGRDEEQPQAVEDAERQRYMSKLTEYTPTQLKELTDLAARLWPGKARKGKEDSK